jgi:peroxiredoxin
LQANYLQFQEKKAEIVALVVEPPARVQSMVASLGYTYPLLADPDHAVSSAYGVYNRLNDQRATPSVFVVDESGIVTWSYIGLSVSDRPSAQQILNQLP